MGLVDSRLRSFHWFFDKQLLASRPEGGGGELNGGKELRVGIIRRIATLCVTYQIYFLISWL